MVFQAGILYVFFTEFSYEKSSNIRRGIESTKGNVHTVRDNGAIYSTSLDSSLDFWEISLPNQQKSQRLVP